MPQLIRESGKSQPIGELVLHQGERRLKKQLATGTRRNNKKLPS
jgi:hypothetical protein